MRTCVYDIEGNDLLIKCTTIHCIVIEDMETGEVFSYRPHEIEDGYRKLQTYDTCIGHNVLGYDKPVLERFFPHLGTLPHHDDTFIMSRMLWGPDDCPAGRHGLKAWGEYFNYPKIEFHEFDVFTEEMLTYCIQDVSLNVKVLNYLREEWTPDLDYGYKLECNVRSIITKQEQNGFTIDLDRHTDLLNHLEYEQAKVRDSIDRIIPSAELTMKTPAYYIADGKATFKTKKDAKAAGYKDKTIVRGPLRTKTLRFNPGSGQQIVDYFQSTYSWEPSVFTENDNASMTGEVLENLDFPEAELFAEYQLLGKRVSQVASWPKFVILDRIHGSVHSLGTVTFRMSHSNPNVGQVTAKNKKHGADCRKCWGPRKGWRLVGTDAKGLEVRMLANALYPYDNGKYIPVVCDGDPHEYNNQLAGLGDRNVAKTGIYAFMYGGGIIKLGKVAKGSASVRAEARGIIIPIGYMRYMAKVGLDTEENMQAACMGIVLKKRFRQNIDGFGTLLDALTEEWIANGKKWIRGIDGRRIPCDKENILLSRRLQSDGAIVMKEALRQHYILMYRAVGPHGERWAYCANIHDEFQVECEPDVVETAKKLGHEAIRRAGVVLGLRCPLAGDSNEGGNWFETH